MWCDEFNSVSPDSNTSNSTSRFVRTNFNSRKRNKAGTCAVYLTAKKPVFRFGNLINAAKHENFNHCCICEMNSSKPYSATWNWTRTCFCQTRTSWHNNKLGCCSSGLTLAKRLARKVDARELTHHGDRFRHLMWSFDQLWNLKSSQRRRLPCLFCWFPSFVFQPRVHQSQSPVSVTLHPTGVAAWARRDKNAYPVRIGWV